MKRENHPRLEDTDRQGRGAVHVELYGIARARAACPHVVLEGLPLAATLADVLRALQDRLPQLAPAVVDGGKLAPGMIANLDGERFVRDPDTPVPQGAHVLITSADVGG